MSNSKAFTLAESLLAFSIYITCIIMLVSMYCMVLNSKKRLTNNYSKFNSESYELCEDYQELIEQVLH